MATQRERTVNERVGDWKQAYDMVKAELTSHDMRRMITDMTSVQPGPNTDLNAYAGLVNSSMALASVVAANDRTAGTIAESITRGMTRDKEPQ